ncbi:hypothetical protein SAMN03159338_1575 [Sphingomonas sp. NFR04]|jgi:hypothetical protein|uniref:hypothetical protein n=1 Tax=Sphingomonas sp. NFR04 TaxID=1566283 RepID=UPI0008ED336D|nr:hypothetical protein [Sphingomonas sp. NFR04]SFJ49882.1 hypothetical protein SAMN03159338_1575 [Sphingomonas sp. NFR04]
MTLEDFIDVDEFVKEIDAEIGDISEAMRTQTARAAWYGIQHSRAKKQAAKVALTLKAIEAKLTTTHRAKLREAAEEEASQTNTKPERVTADMVAAAVALDKSSREWQIKKMDADEIEAICKVAYYAFKTREEMLKSLGILTQAQLKSNLVIQNAREAASSYDQRRSQRNNRARPMRQEADATE